MCHLSQICFYAWWNTAYNAVAGLILRGQGKENVRGVPLSHCGRSFCLIISWHCLRVSRTVLLNSVDGSNNVFLPIKLLKSHIWAKPFSVFQSNTMLRKNNLLYSCKLHITIWNRCQSFANSKRCCSLLPDGVLHKVQQIWNSVNIN